MPKYEVVRANILNQEKKNLDMASVLSEILREEICIVTQASRRQERRTIFLVNKSKNKLYIEIFRDPCHNWKNTDM